MSESRDIVERLRKWEDRHGNVTPGELMDESAAEITRLRDERRWIPASEKLPDLYVEVIGWHPDDRVRSWCRHGGVTVFGKAWESWMPTDEDCEIREPTHWRPLPSPPVSE